MRKYIEIGKIIRPHGINGAVKTEPWCDSPSVLAKLDGIFLSDPSDESGFIKIRITKSSIQKDRVILSLEGIDTPETAERLRGVTIYADRNDIPVQHGAYLIDDLKGLPIIDIDTGALYGKLNDVLQGAASDLYEVATNKGEVLLPAVKAFIKKIDLEKGIYIAPIKGMFDED